MSVDGSPLNHPFLQVRVGNAEGLVFVDTGAALSFLSRGFMERTGLPLRTRELIVNDGRTSRTDQVAVLNNVRFDIGPYAHIVIETVLGITLPPPIVDAGIVGAISPQLAADETSAVVLDFSGDRFARLPIATARQMLSGRRLDDDTTQACRYTEGGLDALIYTTEIVIAGERLRFLIDTAGTSGLASDLPVARALYESTSEEFNSRGVLGDSIDRLARDVPIRVGGHEHVLEELPIALSGAQGQTCPFHGVLGIDVLGACLLVLEPDDISIACP